MVLTVAPAVSLPTPVRTSYAGSALAQTRTWPKWARFPPGDQHDDGSDEVPAGRGAITLLPNRPKEGDEMTAYVRTAKW